MKIKDLFRQLEVANQLYEMFNDKLRLFFALKFYGDEQEYRFYEYEQFLKYINYAYIEEFCALAITRNVYSKDDYMCVMFECNDELCTIKFFLREEYL